MKRWSPSMGPSAWDPYIPIIYGTCNLKGPWIPPKRLKGPYYGPILVSLDVSCSPGAWVCLVLRVKMFRGRVWGLGSRDFGAGRKVYVLACRGSDLDIENADNNQRVHRS